MLSHGQNCSNKKIMTGVCDNKKREEINVATHSYNP